MSAVRPGSLAGFAGFRCIYPGSS